MMKMNPAKFNRAARLAEKAAPISSGALKSPERAHQPSPAFIMKNKGPQQGI